VPPFSCNAEEREEGTPAYLRPAQAGVKCGDIREEEDAAAKHRFPREETET